VLSGGYLLRHYFMYAGVYERPYPAINSSHHQDSHNLRMDVNQQLESISQKHPI